MEEIWKPIVGFEGRYEITESGKCRSLLKRKVELKPHKNKYGYLYVILTDHNNKRKTCTIHRLVAQTFIPNPLGLPEINHIDEDKTNNRVDNLEWCSREYNHNYGTRNKRAKEKNINGKLSKSVLQFSKTGDFIREWESTHEIQRQLGYSRGSISNCCRGVYKQFKGYKWKYKE